MTYELTPDERRGVYASPYTGSIRTLGEILAEESHSVRSHRRARPLQVAAIERGELFACPYVCRGLPYHDPHGTCVFGCWDEPACITNGPPAPGDYCEQVGAAWEALGELAARPAWAQLVHAAALHQARRARPGRVAPPPPPGAASPA